VWKNHKGVKQIDNTTNTGDWVEFEIEITGALAGADEAQIQWRLRSDDESEGDDELYGGWTIDDVEVFTIKPVP
jgi:hypothetical protein